MRQIVAGRALGFEVRGGGAPLLLLHPFPFDRRVWRDVVAELATARRVITLDARGFGESPLDGDYPLEALADDAAALLDHLGVPMATVAGLSMGGYVALAFARRHAARLGALILCDTRAGADSAETRKARDQAIASVRSDGGAAFVGAQPARLLSAAADESLRARVLELARQPADAICAALAAMRDRPDRSAELRALRAPALVIAGSDDALTPPPEARAMAAEISGARFVELAGAGHLSHLEQPAAFCRTITEFLDENGR